MTGRVNKSAKGREAELRAIRILEADGYTVHRSIRTAKLRGGRWISHSNDVLGCIDLIAKRSDTRTRWIQVLTHYGVGRKKADLLAIPWNVNADSVEIWRWIGGRGKHTDGRNGKPRDRMYFQMYLLDDGFRLRKHRRVRSEVRKSPPASDDDPTAPGSESPKTAQRAP